MYNINDNCGQFYNTLHVSHHHEGRKSISLKTAINYFYTAVLFIVIVWYLMDQRKKGLELLGKISLGIKYNITIRLPL